MKSKRRKREIARCLCLYGLPINDRSPSHSVTPRRVRISMAFHEAGHAASAILIGANWQEARLVKYKRQWGLAEMGSSTTHGKHDHQLVGVSGCIGEEIWRLRRGKESETVPFYGLSDTDLEMTMTPLEDSDSDLEPDLEELLMRARDTLCEHQALVAWIARQLIRRGKVDRAFLRRNLPEKLLPSGVRSALFS